METLNRFHREGRVGAIGCSNWHWRRLEEKKGLTPAQIAFAWIFTQPLNVFPITSPSSVEHLHETIEAANTDLTACEAEWLNLEAEDL